MIVFLLEHFKIKTIRFLMKLYGILPMIDCRGAMMFSDIFLSFQLSKAEAQFSAAEAKLAAIKKGNGFIFSFFSE